MEQYVRKRPKTMKRTESVKKGTQKLLEQCNMQETWKRAQKTQNTVIFSKHGRRQKYDVYRV